MSNRTYGHIGSVQIGHIFSDRKAASKARVHGPPVAGIWGGSDGAESIILNAGYIDDEDHGSVVIYTGHGGNDPKTKRQISDQELKAANLGLSLACDRGHPIRVLRGPKLDSKYRCRHGYRYDGLYTVTKYWSEVGKDGFLIWRFRLEAIPGESGSFIDTTEDSYGNREKNDEGNSDAQPGTIATGSDGKTEPKFRLTLLKWIAALVGLLIAAVLWMKSSSQGTHIQ